MKQDILLHKFSCILVFALAVLPTSSGSAQQTFVKPTAGSRWTGTWSASAQEVESKLQPSTPGLADTTLRQVVHVSVGGQQVRVRFSNAFGGFKELLKITAARVAVSAGGNTIKPETDKPLTFHGQTSVTIPWGAMMVSDPVEFDLAPGSDLAVTIHVTNPGIKVTGHRSARAKAAFLQAGDAVSAADLPQAVSSDVWYFLSGVDVLAPETASAVVCFGDSITDGKGSNEGANHRWPDILARRLQANKATAQIGVLNQGIGGNCVWLGGIGQPALVRLDRDALTQPGIRWLVLLEGINDLGSSKAPVEDVIAGYEQIILRAHDRGLLVYGATITPCGASFYFTPELETARQIINKWIRTSGAFDAVIDFDAATRDPQDPSRLLKAADSGDHLHPSDKGHEMLAIAVDLGLFGKQ